MKLESKEKKGAKKPKEPVKGMLGVMLPFKENSRVI